MKVKEIKKKDRELSEYRWKKKCAVRKREYELAAFDPIGALSEAFLWKNSVV